MTDLRPMKPRKPTASQNRMILQYLREGGTLDPLKALRLFDSWALRSRICEIEGKSGHAKMLKADEAIERLPVHNTKTGKRYKCYRLRVRGKCLKGSAAR